MHIAIKLRPWYKKQTDCLCQSCKNKRATSSLSFAKLGMFIMMYIFCWQINKYIKWKGQAQLVLL